MKQRNVGRARAAPRSSWFGPSARDPANHDASGPATPWDGKGRAIETHGCRSTGPDRQLRQLQNSQRNRLLVLQLKPPPQLLRARRTASAFTGLHGLRTHLANSFGTSKIRRYFP